MSSCKSSSCNRLAELEIPNRLLIPKSLCGCWKREYIKQSFRAPRATDKQPEGGVVWYLQSSTGVCVDVRVDLTGGGDHDCFVGIALWDGEESILNWHSVVTYVATATEGGGTKTKTDAGKLLQDVAARALKAPHATEDRGCVKWEDASQSSWIETAVDGGSDVLEERWLRNSAENKQDVDVDVAVDVDAPAAAATTFVDVCRTRSNVDKTMELLLQSRGFFAHVHILQDGRTEFSMGKVHPDNWRIEVSTQNAKIGATFDLNPWVL
eukprot:TRINITY_DN9988_c1_g1_i6.p1 TRINITY_DN9988_c1_g1~~TRINITY_DN9988_c1_g1_i6.p1  ORF type:complete len:267 (-),score=51.98 TRINITY_DN9988_c1_g1_i6:361-1161(-)